MYAPVQKGFIFRDEVSGISRGYALIEFDTVESASKVVSTHGYFTVKGIQVVIGYVNEYIGYQWGYRILSIAMSVLMILCILSIQLYLKNHKKQNKC